MGQATREEKRTKQAKKEQGISEQEKQQPRDEEEEEKEAEGVSVICRQI